MNYFRCTVGGSGKGNTVTVTCAEEFAGLTITLSKTGKTYTKTCPSTAPYVVTFNGVENGTYTVSATYGGRTYSESVVVKNIDCILNYGFGWVTWVNTAQYLDASDYASLDEVLEDEAAIRELFLEHACVDYMAEAPASNSTLVKIINNDLCAKWINLSDYALDYLHANEVIADLMDEADKYGYGEWALMPQVPKMTSNTVPYGEAIASSYQSSNGAYNVFDGSDTSYWAATPNTLGYVGYHYISPVIVKKIKFITGNSASITWKVKYSDDGLEWNEIEGSEFISSPNVWVEKAIDNNSAHSYWCVEAISSSIATTASVATLQFYAWAPKGNVPVMTSNTAPYGTASAYRSTTNADPYRAFDGNPSSAYANGQNQSTSDYLQYKFNNPVRVKRFYILPNAIADFVSYSIKASNDGSTWETLFTGTNTSANPFTQNINNDDYYLFYRVTCNSTSSSYWFGIKELQFYGRELKVSVPTMTSNTAPYGEASANSENTSADYKLWKAFDGNANTQWLVGSAVGTSHTNLWIRYKFTTPMVARFAYVLFSSNINSQSYMIQGSNDATTWATLANGNKTGSDYIYINNDTPYLYYQLFISTQTLSQSLSGGRVTTLQFYGLDYSEKEFEVGTTKKWLYDHGVELETFNAFQQGSNGVTEKRNDELYFASGSDNTGFRIASAIDLSAFSLLRWKVGREFIANSNGYDSVNIRQTPTSSTTAYGRIGMSLPYNGGFDISSVTSDMYIQANTTGNGKATLTEWWLE